MSKKCCRCVQDIPKGQELGGTFGGVVCKKHRSCPTCWFSTDYLYGNRRYEPRAYRRIPLVNNPRKGRKPRCFGCLKKLPPHKAYTQRQKKRSKKMKLALKGVDMTKSGKSWGDAIVL